MEDQGGGVKGTDATVADVVRDTVEGDDVKGLYLMIITPEEFLLLRGK